MDFYGIKGRSEAWLASREEISSLLLQVNELLSEPEPDEVSELKTENENLKKEVQKTRNDLDSKCEVFQKEIKRLERENERLRRQLEAMEELLSEPKPDIVSELKMENENLKKEVQTTKTELDSKFEVFKTEIKRLEKENENLRRHIETLEERLEQLNEVKATRNTADNLQSRMKKLELDREWFDTENRNLKETVKRLERERDDYKQKVHRLSGQSASNMEVTIGGSKVLHEKELLQGQKVTVLQGDIVQITADAIVHPTNSTFETRGAVGSALGKAGGDDFLRDIKALHLSHGTLEVAKAALSKGKNFPAKYVIHVHSPGWRHENAKQMLDAATKNVLTLAEEHNIRSIAIPSISSGHAGFPKLTAAETILRAINNYFSNSTSSLKQVYFVLFDAESVTAYITELRRLSV
ncbi:core histone macro-H2A.1-like isoform X1 [Mercenaria mercenaria]|uniref:core histone macro-H2A.1-like isoform X1 n=1 Tax=Mercenaria mercenaria TaxID=6596 RepID=UPI00234F6836|nr:core histone macro-H2A.1-like isoform X1 [Mercenaria mercenaria]